ncbi:MAG: family 43 glycosylhydrolase, partial [Acidobacteriota bacterium]|nr:family 43 glycosylhydrolase [Acidobacteriota bacterium]
ALGVVHASAGSNLLKSSSWKKFDHPFFRQDREHSVFGPGHNGFFQSPDGREDWIVYHANATPGQGCGDHRSPRIQKFHWIPTALPPHSRRSETELIKRLQLSA